MRLAISPQVRYICKYVSVKSFFVLFSFQLESTWASKDDQAGFVTQCHGLKLLRIYRR